jgi:transmembrane sensor
MSGSLQDRRGARANEAAEWFLRLKDDEVTEHDLSRWLEWCSVPENLREFQRTRNIWRNFGDLGPAAAEMLEALLPENEPSLRLRSGDAAPAGSQQLQRKRWHASRVFGRAVAATVIATVAIVGVWYARDIGILGPSEQVARRPVIRSNVLPDGSTLTLAPRTEVDVEFSAIERTLKLSHGEAFFKVQPDKAKPFVVQTSGLNVVAVGTAFDVRSREDRVIVTVEEGIVEVARVSDAATAAAGNWRVNAGYQIAYDVRTGGARIAAVDTERAPAWREGRLEYFSEPLGSVAADVSRYSARPIEIADPQLADLTFTGTVFTGSVDDWLAAVESTFPIRAEVAADQSVRLVSRPPHARSREQ